MGCYKMALQALDNYFLRVGSISSIGKRYEACEEKADADGISLFGMDDRRCWTSEQAGSSYDKFGASGKCKKKGAYSTGFSESDTVFVYQKEKGNWQALAESLDPVTQGQ